MLWFSFFSPIIILSCTLNGAEMPRRGILQNTEWRMALFSICKWSEKTIWHCFLTLWEQCHSVFCVLQNIPAQDAILCWFALWRLSLFSTYPPRPSCYPPTHVCLHSTQEQGGQRDEWRFILYKRHAFYIVIFIIILVCNLSVRWIWRI